MAIMYTSKTIKEIKAAAAGFAPAAITAAGFAIAMSGAFKASVYTEFMVMKLTVFCWIGLACFEGWVLLVRIRKEVSRDAIHKAHRSMAVIVVAWALVGMAMSVLTGEDAVLVCYLHSAPYVYPLCAASIIAIATGHMRSAKLLMVIVAGLILFGWMFPLTAANWDGLKYSEEIFRMAILSEMMVPLYVISILPPASVERREKEWVTRKVRI